jgi:ABC-type bacteriocin/lantibiotic exporter with double-glycine peptidase domain
MYESIMYGKAGVENAKEIEQAIETNTAKGKKRVIDEWKTLDIRGLNFSYENTTQDDSRHLDDINLTITRGERIACIGESGSGKTTFLKILHGLYDSAHANVTFDQGKEISTNFTDIKLETMLVPQEPEVFSSTIKENITLGLEYSNEEISKVTNLAQFTDVIKQLPNGLQSVINEKGVNLSGGQKQRLALARAVLFAQEKDVILLDESTSSVDPENESLIYQNILKEFAGKTILASIHKMNLLKHFDKIVIFADGKVIDIGTFNELLKRNKRFKKNWEKFVERTKE